MGVGPAGRPTPSPQRPGVVGVGCWVGQPGRSRPSTGGLRRCRLWHRALLADLAQRGITTMTRWPPPPPRRGTFQGAVPHRPAGGHGHLPGPAQGSDYRGPRGGGWPASAAPVPSAHWRGHVPAAEPAAPSPSTRTRRTRRPEVGSGTRPGGPTTAPTGPGCNAAGPSVAPPPRRATRPHAGPAAGGAGLAAAGRRGQPGPLRCPGHRLPTRRLDHGCHLNHRGGAGVADQLPSSTPHRHTPHLGAITRPQGPHWPPRSYR